MIEMGLSTVRKSVLHIEKSTLVIGLVVVLLLGLGKLMHLNSPDNNLVQP